MKKFFKWAGIALVCLFFIGFIGFLYFIPPFQLAPQEEFINPVNAVMPTLDKITDPAKRAIAERGKYLVQTIGCTGCHTPGGDKGPKFETEFLAGGLKFTDPLYGTVVSRNLTPDPTTGLARRSDHQVLRTLRSGVFAENGRVFDPLFMPWADFSNLTEEDRYAILTYVRILKPVKHTIPDFKRESEQLYNSFYGQDYGIHEGSK
jgi:mono/diheme cytochrome c family protein